ncbi:MAG: hypothetical protein J6Q83_01795 [Clostridia bacterium]|nr:hypothetical protein [Clostridia bacterium]
MIRFRKTISILCVLAMVFSYAACGKKKTEQVVVENNQQDYQNEQNIIINNDPVVTDNADSYQTEAYVQTQPAATQAPVQTQASQTEAPAQPTEAPTQPLIEHSFSVQTIIYDEVTPRQTVYCPPNMSTSNSTYPVLVWANGTMVTADFYASLLTDLSNMGYIVIASDENMSADGTAQLYSLDFVINEGNNPDSPLYGKIDANRVALIGHSQGGRSSVNASTDSRVKCVISIAGSNFDYEAELDTKPTLFFGGTKDWIVSPEQWLVTAFDAVRGPAVYGCLNGATHTTCTSDPSQYTYYIDKWCDAWLNGNEQSKGIFRNGGEMSNDGRWTDFRSKGF